MITTISPDPPHSVRVFFLVALGKQDADGARVDGKEGGASGEGAFAEGGVAPGPISLLGYLRVEVFGAEDHGVVDTQVRGRGGLVVSSSWAWLLLSLHHVSRRERHEWTAPRVVYPVAGRFPCFHF